MTYIFKGTLDDCSDGFFNLLDKAAQDPRYSRFHFCNAMVNLVGIYPLLARTDVNPAELERFRRDSAERLVAFAKNLGAYVPQTLDLATEQEWYQTCIRRSAIESLLTDYASTEATALIDPEDVTELDDELRRIGVEQGPVPPEFIPEGMPDSHWWWHYPTAAATS